MGEGEKERKGEIQRQRRLERERRTETDRESQRKEKRLEATRTKHGAWKGE